MSTTEKFFRALAWFGLGVIMGFLLAPIKRGVNISICSNNEGTSFGSETKPEEEITPDMEDLAGGDLWFDTDFDDGE